MRAFRSAPVARRPASKEVFRRPVAVLERLRLWAPVAARGAAVGLALLGLAAIGSAVQLPPVAAPGAPEALELASLGGHEVGAALGGPPAAGSSGSGSTVAALPAAGSSRAGPSGSAARAQRPPSSNAAGSRRERSDGRSGFGAAGGPERRPVPDTPGAAPVGGSRAGREAPCAEQARPVDAAGLAADGRVILNQAGGSTLQRLPGIGARRAEAILALRERLGRFRRVEDLLRVKGIGRRTLDRLRPDLVLDAPAPTPPLGSGEEAPPGR